ncbi:MAG TPA: Nramp family divalent metal transporter [Actinomycetota bacterium]|nr:Nramp family divalent metal transporter [Actinomycetota bacterium]
MGAKAKDRKDRHHPGRGRLRGFGYFGRLGPGFVTGAADDDPAGIGTYSQIGASFRFDLVWTAPLSLPLAAAVQETAARLGLTTGRGLMSLIKERFSAWVMWVAVVLVVGANVFNIGADLGSMADALKLLVPVPFAVLVIVMTAVILALEVFVTYDRYAIVLRWLALSILAYVIELVVVDVDWSAVAAGLVPSFHANAAFVEALVAIFGTTISPYLFLWQAGEEMEEVKAKKITRVDATQVKAMRVDVFSGISAGILVMFAIMVTAGSTIGAQGATQIRTADQAAKALEPIAGQLSSTLFALGIVGTGLLAIPTLAGSAAYALSEAFGWREGLGRSVRQAPGFYGVISAAMLLGLLLNFVGIDPIRALFLSAILNGLAAPPLILLMLILSRSGKGPREGGWLSTVLVSIALGVMTLAAIAYLVTLVAG